MQKIEVFNWTTKFQIVWETIKSKFIDALGWDFECHVHINVSNLVVGMMLVALNVFFLCVCVEFKAFYKVMINCDRLANHNER
jgi:hypothetical protein